ncbi:ERI1 exoribonuclease 3, partial [Araneus ventricosus]
MALLVRSMKISKMIKQSTPQEVIKSICCTNMKEECLERTCQECNKKIVTTLYYDPQTKIKFELWVTKKVKVIIHGNEKISQKTVKETVECSKQELFKEFMKSMPTFMQHVNNVNHQHQIINKIKENLQKKEALLHIDFSENFNCKYAEEIQSTHFGSSKKQLSLHTSVLYCNQQLENKTKPLCFCTVSENLRHDAAAICIHLKPILQELVVQVPQLETLHILSDGPSTQYKNKKIFYLLGTFIARETGAFRCVWHFSETGHGKGAPDGVGGTLKRTADNIIAQGHDITGQDEFVSLLKSSCPGIKVIGINKDADAEMKKIDDLLEKKNIATFKGTMKAHQIAWSKKNKQFLDVRRLSCITCKPEEKCIHFSLGQFHLAYKKQKKETDDDHNSSNLDADEVLKNKYVIVCFEGKKNFKKHYIGVVTEEHQNKCKVNFLRRSGNKVFSFPQQEILEFPVVKVNAETFRPEATFHSYVRPTVVPELSDFCTALTGIIQEMIDQQPDFKVVFQNFLAWLEKEQVLKPGVKFAFVTCSDPDLEYFFPLQCQISGIEVPDFMKRWINVKRSFCDIPPYTYPANLTTMMRCCDITPEGELHSGI